VEIFDRVARRMEQLPGAGFHEEAVTESIRHKAVRSAVELANSIDGSKIVVFTRRGFMADHFSQLRPEKAPIYAFTPSEDVARRLTLNWATVPIVMRFDLDPNFTIAEAEKILLDRGLAQIGTQLVILSDVVTGNERFDSIQIRRVA
jgi:pyruvate kinase